MSSLVASTFLRRIFAFDAVATAATGVLLSVGAKILGNITVGDEAKVAAGSVVLKDVPGYCTVAGVPAKVVAGPTCCQPAQTMDQGLPDTAET